MQLKVRQYSTVFFSVQIGGQIGGFHSASFLFFGLWSTVTTLSPIEDGFGLQVRSFNNSYFVISTTINMKQDTSYPKYESFSDDRNGIEKHDGDDTENPQAGPSPTDSKQMNGNATHIDHELSHRPGTLGYGLLLSNLLFASVKLD